MNQSKKNSLLIYFVLAFLIPIIATIVITLTEGRPSEIVITQITITAMVVILAMVHAPTIAAMIASYKDQGFAGIKKLFQPLKYWKFSPKWYASALLMFPSVILLTLFGLSIFSSKFLPVLGFALFIPAGLISPFFEEIGWTGYATPRMLNKYSPLKVGIILGIIHALWHLPADIWGAGIFHGDLFLIHFLINAIGIVAYRIIAVWIYSRTKSLVLGWLTHASFTGGQILFVSMKLTSKETVIWQAAFMFVVCLVTIFIVVKNWHWLRKSS